jgi:hypothetical protein
MTRCLNERALVRLYFKEGTADEHSHLRLCADCAETYDRLVHDLEAIHHILADTPPRTAAAGRLAPWRWVLLPAAAVSVAMIAIVISIGWLRQPASVQLAAGNRNLSAFADDVSSAVFAGVGSDDAIDIRADAPDLRVALADGWPCTRDAFFNGECSDQVSALLLEVE